MAHVYDMERAQAARILSMMAIGMIVGSPCLSYLSNNIFKGRKPVLILCSVLTLIQTGFLAFYTDRLSVPGLYLLCLGFGVFTSAIVVIAFTNNKELFPVQMAGTATGLINLFPFAGGAVFQPVLGAILEHYGRIGDRFTLQGYQSAFLVLFLCALIALVASFFLRETMKPA